MADSQLFLLSSTKLGVGQATAWLGLTWLKPQFSWLEFSLAWLKPKYFGLPSQQAKIKPIFKIVLKNFYTYSCVLKFYLSKIFGKCKNIKIIFENGLAWLGLPIFHLAWLGLSQKSDSLAWLKPPKFRLDPSLHQSYSTYPYSSDSIHQKIWYEIHILNYLIC